MWCRDDPSFARLFQTAKCYTVPGVPLSTLAAPRNLMFLKKLGSRTKVIIMIKILITILLLLPSRSVGLLVSPSDPSLFFSPGNWQITDALASTVNPGAYAKLSFRGSSSVALLVDAMPCLWSSCMTLSYSIDGLPLQLKDNPVRDGTVSIPLAEKLDPSTTHSLAIHVYNSIQYGNRWLDVGQAPYTDQRQALLLWGVLLDDGAQAIPSKLRPKRLLAFGDSITEGVGAVCEGQGDLQTNAATKTWVQATASALSAEYGQVGFGRQGWTIEGNAQVPPFFTPGLALSDKNSTWGYVFEGAQRSFAALDYVFVLHGTNDGLSPATSPPSRVVAACEGWLHAVRAAVGSQTVVFLVVPFGGFGSANPPINALAEAFSAYQSSAVDARVRLPIGLRNGVFVLVMAGYAGYLVMAGYGWL